jgi:hypothetical protein
VRDFSVAHRQVPGPGQTLLAALVGARGFAQTVRAARAAGVVLRVLQPQGARDQNFPGHIVNSFGVFVQSLFIHPQLAPSPKTPHEQPPQMLAGMPVGPGVTPQPGFYLRGDHFHAWTGKIYLVSSAIFCHLRRNPAWNS